jgi:hypothetical protein
MLRTLIVCLLVFALASTMVLAQETTEAPTRSPGAAYQFQPVMLLVLLPAFLYSLL